MTRARRRTGEQDGQSLVEVALIAPVVLLVLLLAVDFGRVFLGWVTINNMARIGANYAALNPQGFQNNDPGVTSQYRTLVQSDASGIDCALPATIPAPVFSGYNLGDNVTVALSCNFPLLTPLLGNLMGHPSGMVPIGGTAVFNVRSGSVNNVPINPPHITPPPLQTPVTSPGSSVPPPTTPPTATPTASPTPTPAGTPAPGATPTPPPTAVPTPVPTPTPLPLVHISFYGVPASGQPDATGGGPPGSTNENQIVGATGLTVQFSNTTTGTQVACNWDFGDGSTQSNCASTVSKIYTTRGVYNVTLSVNASTLTRPSYVLVGCKVPVLAGNKLHFNEAGPIWTAAGFTGPISAAPGSTGNFPINFQAPVGGQVNPTGGCAAGITLGK